MDAADIIIANIGWLILAVTIMVAVSIAASLHTTRLKIKHGYPLEGMWGQSLKPGSDKQMSQRVTLLTQENAQLKAEVGAMRDRLETVERIVTDSGYRLTNEIEQLRAGKEKVQ